MRKCRLALLEIFKSKPKPKPKPPTPRLDASALKNEIDALGPDANAGPGLLGGVLVLAEQHALACFAAGQQHQQRLRFGKARQVMEITVLAKGVFAVVAARGQVGRLRRDLQRVGEVLSLIASSREFQLA